jgi:signal transduction histidine kinase
VDIDADGIGRYQQETEAAVYFCCLEALQNVAKYAGPSRVRIRLSEALDQLMFQVARRRGGVRRGFDVLRLRPAQHGRSGRGPRWDGGGGVPAGPRNHHHGADPDGTLEAER